MPMYGNLFNGAELCMKKKPKTALIKNEGGLILI